MEQKRTQKASVKPKKKKLTAKQKKQLKLWRAVRPAVVVAVSLLVVLFVARYAVNEVLSRFIYPVDVEDATPIEVVIPSSSSASKIAHILYTARGENEPGLIPSTAAFKVYVDFVGKANKMQAGTYILSRNMSLKQIVDIICEGNPPKATVKFTVPEGYTIMDIARVLQEKGLLDNEQSLFEACKDDKAFETFGFIDDIVKNGDKRRYYLEGYLFPDTYEAFEDASVDSILIRMLNRFNEIYSDEYIARAEELGMTMDEVVTLASLIEREAQMPEDFAKVSAVFHNRLSRDMQLQSCASLSYVLNVKKYTFTEAELSTESPYNTYRHAGLPVGPICNPGKAAIEAALYPNAEYVEGEYLYFCNGNLKVSTELVFAKTYEEHQANVMQYQQYWD